MEIPVWFVNAFTDQPFAGDPAAVCLMSEWPEDEVLQAIAKQNNLSETAFVDVDDLRLRWFAPTTEVVSHPATQRIDGKDRIYLDVASVEEIVALSDHPRDSHAYVEIRGRTGLVR